MKLTCPCQPASPARGIALALLATTSLSIAMLSDTPAYAQEVASYDIPAGPLSTVLNQFARQAHVELIYDAPLTQGATSPGLKGSYGTAEGLSRILAGTSLSYRQTGLNMFTLERAPTADAGAVQLGPVRVAGSSAPAGGTAADDDDDDGRHPLQLAKSVQAGALGSSDSQLDTPFSTTIVDDRQLRLRQVATLDDVFRYDGSVTVNNTGVIGEAGAVSVRGLPLDTENGFKIDGSPIPAYRTDLPIELFDRVELLKGLSGFMYGFGTPGGVINYVTKKPTDTPLRRVEIGFSSDSVWSEYADIGGRAGPDGQFGYRGSVVHKAGGTFNGGSTDVTAGEAAFDVHITPNLTWSITGLYQDARNKGVVAAIGLLYSGSDVPSAISGRSRLAADGTHYNTRFAYGRSALDWQFASNWKASLSASGSILKRYVVDDYLFVSNSAGDYRDFIYDTKNRYGYLEYQALVEGDFDLLGMRHHVVIGGSRQTLDYKVGNLDALTPVGTGNLFASNSNSYGAPLDQYLVKLNSYVQMAGFISDRVELLPGVTVLGGLRYTDYDEHGYDFDGTPLDHYHKKPISPTAALIYKPIQTVSLYASYVQSLEQGGSADISNANYPKTFPPLRSEQYEAGIKVDTQIWNLSAALFRIDRGANYVDSANNFVQDGITRYQGFDASASWSPIPSLTLVGSAMLLDAKYKKTSDFVENRVAGAAERQFGAQIAYRPSIAPSLTLYGGIRYMGEVYLDSANTKRLPDYATGDLGFDYTCNVASVPIRLALDMTNLTGAKYWYYRSDNFEMPGEPRLVRLRLGVNF